MEATTFASILAELVRRIPGAIASALVDAEGETVDYGGDYDSFMIRVAAAHVRILLNDLQQLSKLGTPRWLIISGSDRTFVGRTLPEGYALVVIARRRVVLEAWASLYEECEAALIAEAGWAPMSAAETCVGITVLSDALQRPRAVGIPPVNAEVLGETVGLPPGETGYRVRLANGCELSVVRSASGAWTASEPTPRLLTLGTPAAEKKDQRERKSFAVRSKRHTFRGPPTRQHDNKRPNQGELESDNLWRTRIVID
jgi:hypothetical protein